MDITILNQSPLPNFSVILPEQIESALKKVIGENRAALHELLAQTVPFSWENLSMPLEEIGDKLSKFWSPISHLHSVAQNEALRNAYNNCLPLLSDYSTELLQNELLFAAISAIANNPEFANFNQAQRKVIENDLRDFKLAGVGLPPAEKARYAELQKQYSTVTTKFSENLLDATHAWTFHVTDVAALKGLSDQILQLLAENAKQNEKEGWLITLDYPCYSAVMKYSDNRELRRSLYEAYVTRASDQGPHAGQYDNGPLMETILNIRSELASLLGFKNYAEYSLATKMADNTQEVMNFLDDLVPKAKKIAEQEIQEMREFAKQTDGITQLESWDLSYYTEKLRGSKYALHEEEIKAYFPINKVLEGLFAIVKRIFGITITERTGVDTWNPSVQFFDIFDEKNQLRGSLYTDLYARPHKRDGAWMDDCRVRRKLPDGSLQQPVAFLTCNFSRPIGDQPALLTHNDVTTLFHEFGHCLHHLLTQMEYAGVSGINGVPWDAVEVPSQFLEHWCWEKEALALISQHIETGEPLPDSLYQKLIAAKNFQAGMYLLRQLEFAIFDFQLHLEKTSPTTSRIQELLDEVRDSIAVYKTPRFNRFQNSFSHIFAGGYAAGYYSYLWAEVLSSDAYSKFEETGIFNHETGRAFLQTILEKGGSVHPMDLFIAFRGRKPKIDALLRHHGITEGT